MALLKKANIAAPVLPKETVAVEELGGEVVVRGLLLSERLALYANANDEGRVFARIPALLAQTVVDADGAAIYDAAAWEAFGAQHMDAALRLFGVAKRLSGLDAESAAKN